MRNCLPPSLVSVTNDLGGRLQSTPSPVFRVTAGPGRQAALGPSLPATILLCACPVSAAARFTLQLPPPLHGDGTGLGGAGPVSGGGPRRPGD